MSVVDVVKLRRYEVLTDERERDVLVARGDPGWLGVSAPRPHIWQPPATSSLFDIF